MGFFTRLANGWEITKTSFKVLNANKQLIVFPILSGISLTLVIGFFLYKLYSNNSLNFAAYDRSGKVVFYLLIFLFYIVNYFIVVFFNMGLMHCAKLYFDGEEVTVAKGLQFSSSRVGAIFSWAVFAATAGTLLRIIQDNAGWLGKIIIGLVGIVWSVAVFFVIPVIAYENAGPYDAVKRSAELVKEKWGESIGANFSIGLVGAAAFLLVGIVGIAISCMIDEQAGILVFGFGVLAIIAMTSALNSIFISAVYNNVNGNINDHFNNRLLDSLFVEK